MQGTYARKDQQTIDKRAAYASSIALSTIIAMQPYQRLGGQRVAIETLNVAS